MNIKNQRDETMDPGSDDLAKFKVGVSPGEGVLISDLQKERELGSWDKGLYKALVFSTVPGVKTISVT